MAITSFENAFGMIFESFIWLLAFELPESEPDENVMVDESLSRK